jgi:hypothetical protein
MCALAVVASAWYKVVDAQLVTIAKARRCEAKGYINTSCKFILYMPLCRAPGVIEVLVNCTWLCCEDTIAVMKA